MKVKTNLKAGQLTVVGDITQGNTSSVTVNQTNSIGGGGGGTAA
jgi:hypothetical protein